jgi:hypothetical protein
VAIEGVCKMLFTTKLCEDNDSEKVEAILGQLIIQMFDRKYNWHNSFVRSLLTVFFKNFVLTSKKRGYLLMNALTKVLYSILR